jgi:four helix bundle protein
MSDKPHAKFIVWQKGMDFAVELYRLTKSFPPQEKYGIAAQLQKTAVSIPANISEGAARKTTKELLHFLSISAGSLSELDTELEICRRVKLIDEKVYFELTQNLEEISKLLLGLAKSLRKKL